MALVQVACWIPAPLHAGFLQAEVPCFTNTANPAHTSSQFFFDVKVLPLASFSSIIIIRKQTSTHSDADNAPGNGSRHNMSLTNNTNRNCTLGDHGYGSRPFDSRH